MNKPVSIVVIFILLLLVNVISSCKPGVPRKYLSPGKMEDILYDYHVAKGMISFNEADSDTLLYQVYKLAVLKKYGISEADFDSSMVYYTRHTHRLHKIYENLAKRLSQEAMAMGASASEIKQSMGITEAGDTANIWSGEESFVLSPQPGFNVYSYTLEADSSYHAGDDFILIFDARFIYQEGMRDGIALISLTFNNDSTTSQMMRLNVDNTYRVDIGDHERLGIKKVSGYFILNRNQKQDSQTTLKLMSVTQLALLRIHTPEPEKKPEPEERKDTLNVALPIKGDSDSIVRPKNLPKLER